MDKQNVSNTYVPLKPPFKIIKHGPKIGVQIGTHRVIVAGGNPFRTETHDYPVVAAENRIAALKNSDFHVDGSCDGEVWDNVETKHVSVLCETGISLKWQQFIEILWHDHARYGDIRQPINKVLIYEKIIKNIISMMLPSPDLYTIHLYTESSTEGTPEVVRSARDDVFALNVVWTDDLDELENRLIRDLKTYLLILSPNRSTNYWHMHYETEEERLLPLVERLNANSSATSFRKSIMASFTVTALPTYEKENSSPSSPTLPAEKHGKHYYGKNINIFHPNLDPDKIAKTILTLDRIKAGNKKIADRHFCLILYKVFHGHPSCMTTDDKSKLLDWVKYNCKIYFETHDLKKVKLDREEEQRVEIYHAVFADRQPNGKWYFKKQYYRTDAHGFPLQSIEGVW